MLGFHPTLMKWQLYCRTTMLVLVALVALYWGMATLFPSITIPHGQYVVASILIVGALTTALWIGLIVADEIAKGIHRLRRLAHK